MLGSDGARLSASDFQEAYHCGAAHCCCAGRALRWSPGVPIGSARRLHVQSLLRGSFCAGDLTPEIFDDLCVFR